MVDAGFCDTVYTTSILGHDGDIYSLMSFSFVYERVVTLRMTGWLTCLEEAAMFCLVDHLHADCVVHGGDPQEVDEGSTRVLAAT